MVISIRELYEFTEIFIWNSGADGGSATIHINDASANQEYHNSTTSRFAHINVDKAAGTFTPGVWNDRFLLPAIYFAFRKFYSTDGNLLHRRKHGARMLPYFRIRAELLLIIMEIVRLDPDFSGCSTRTATVSSSASPKIEFYDLFVDVDNTSCNEDILSITSGDTLVVRNDFTHQDGYINTGVVRVHGDIYLE